MYLPESSPTRHTLNASSTGVGHTQLLRLYAISLCTWYITYFALKSIKKEWVQNLVLRRVYYLEADHYGKRKAELSQLSSNAPGREDKNGDIDPWIPHPEHRDTVPNVELYSVLVGGLPSISNEVANSKDMETAMGLTRKAGIDWQLTVATSFFDHCVPNQPGFSSSVVAVTILPGAPELAKAWRKWYAAAAALRRLRFIRQVIKERVSLAVLNCGNWTGSSSDILFPAILQYRRGQRRGQRQRNGRRRYRVARRHCSDQRKRR